MTKDNVAIAVIPIAAPTVAERSRNAAEEGDIEALYGLIRETPGFLKDIDQMEFVDTPLHIAAAAGRTKFAIELMCLKPSFLTKLNQDGLSPLHLALHNEHAETALSLLEFDKNLPRLKGKNCYTPLHYVVMKGDIGVLKKFLKDCPECINDVTNNDETALHLAAGHKNLEALRVLLHWLWISDRSMLQMRTIVNSKNTDGNTVLHIAAYNNHPKIIRHLIRQQYSCNLNVINLEATNSKNLTALGILKGGDQEENKEGVDILRRYTETPWRYVVAFRNCLMTPLEEFSELAYEIRNMSGDRSNALLVATVLILTATYQAALSPPGGVFQANSQPDHQHNTTSITSWLVHSGANHNTSTPPWWNRPIKFKRNPFTTGSSVLSTAHFLGFFIPNIGAFCVSFFVTCLALIQILPAFLSFILVLSLSMLIACLLVSAVVIISPNSQSLNFMVNFVFWLIYFIFVIILAALLPRIAKRVSNRRFMRNIRNNKS